MKRYLICFVFAIGTLVALKMAYRRWPSTGTGVESRQCEIASSLVPFNRDLGTRCLPNTVYLIKKRQYPEPFEVFDPRCGDLQHRLAQAVENGNLESARAAIAEGANPNSFSDYEPAHSLILATGMDRKDIVRLLLDNGADVNDPQCCCMECRTPLMAAVETGDVCLVRMLIARGADACYDIPYTDGETISTLAEQRGHKEIATLVNQACATAWKRDPQPDRELMLFWYRTTVGRKY